MSTPPTRGLAHGRFEKDADPLFRALNDSLGFDYRLAAADIQGSRAWARALGRAGVLSDDEPARLDAALATLAEQVTLDPERPRREGAGRDEDVHSWVERRLIEVVGPLGKKLHTGRSRNDQVATDLRLWLRAELDARTRELRDARRSLLGLAARELGGPGTSPTIMPGYTHLQRAQPVLFSHWVLAHEEALSRDHARLRDARARVNRCPLGSGALAGTAYPIDRDALARDLGFDGPTRNSLDATGGRDFVLESLAAVAIVASHLSRVGEDLVLFGSQEFGFIEFDDGVASGSSLMPQKKNPDAAELLRGKAGRAVGGLVAMLTTLKGLPLAYNKDLQEDKEPLFDAMDQLSLCLRVMPRIAEGLTVNRAACLSAARRGHSNATDLADYLVSRGVPFREAHDAVGRAVRHAIARGAALEELPLDELRAFSDRIGPDVFARLSIEAGLAAREVAGGTGPHAVAAALASALSRLDAGD